MTRPVELGPIPPITVRCAGCARVRSSGYGTPWEDHPARIAGEVEGICATCLELRRRVARGEWAREGRELLRQRKRGYGAAPVGADVFVGFRGEK